MAKKPTKVIEGRPAAAPVVVDFVDSRLKVGGMVYTFSKPYTTRQSKFLLAAGFTLSECVDGFYQVFDLAGDKHFLRLGPRIIRELLTDNYIFIYDKQGV